MNPAALYPRWITSRLNEAITDTPVVLLVGPRQAGKTTLVREIAARSGLRYLTLDDASTLLAAREDPVGLIRSLDRAVIDEVQRAPELLLAIKKSVDDDRRPGRFLLTGSANLMTLPLVADSLAGRMETLSLLPLSQAEIEGQDANWLDTVFDGQIPVITKAACGPDLVDKVLRGGYPEAIARATSRRRRVWARQYLNALLQRDVRDIAQIGKLDQLPRFLDALAQTSGQPCNYTQLGGHCGMDAKTAARYVGVFEQMFLLRRSEVWARNRLSRAAKTPKLHFIDSGLLAALIDLDIDEVQSDRTRFGRVLESFVFGELLKHASAASDDYRLLHYRDPDQLEVDLVVENAAGRILGVEVKASATVTSRDLRGLHKLSRLAGDAFVAGILLYDGLEVLPLGERLWAVPFSTLWGTAPPFTPTAPTPDRSLPEAS